LAVAGSHETGTVRAEQPRRLSLHGALDFDHVIDGNAFGDADDQIQAGINTLEDGVSSEGRRDKNRGSGRAGLLDRLGDSVENRHYVLEPLAAFAWGNAGDYFGAVRETQLSVPGAEGAGDALDQEPCFRSDENGHDK